MKLRVSTAGIDLFRGVFFDCVALSRAELALEVRARVALGVRRGVDEGDGESVIARVVSGDARVVALGMPSSPVAWQALRLSLGYSPGRVELSRIIDSVVELAALRAQAAVLRGDDGDERRADGGQALF